MQQSLSNKSCILQGNNCLHHVCLTEAHHAIHMAEQLLEAGANPRIKNAKVHFFGMLYTALSCVWRACHQHDLHC